MIDANLFTLAADPISQVVNQRWISAEDGTWLWSAHLGNLVVAAIVTVGMLWFAARHIRTGPESLGADRYVTKNKFAHFLEVLICYIRDEVIVSLLGKRAAKFAPFLLTLFFFILVNNLLGMLPISKALWLIFPEWKKEHILPIGMTATQRRPRLSKVICTGFLRSGKSASAANNSILKPSGRVKVFSASVRPRNWIGLWKFDSTGGSGYVLLSSTATSVRPSRAMVQILASRRSVISRIFRISCG